MADGSTLQRGDKVPDFEVRTLAGDVFRYSSIWQRKHLVLVTLPDAASDTSRALELAARDPTFHEYDSVCIVTRDSVTGLPAPAALVADRWGEIVHVAVPSSLEGLPAPSELLDWLDYLERRCPECEGEAK